MQNFLQKLRQSSIVFEKPGFLSKKLKTFTSWNYYRFQYFLLELNTRYLLNNACKRVFKIFLFCLDLELIANTKKTGFYTLIFYIFINNSRSKQNNNKKKFSNTLLWKFLSRKRV